jgi:hypothetical protein
MSWDAPHEQDRVCVWCGVDIHEEAWHTTTDHSGPYHFVCLPPIPGELSEPAARLVLAGTH